MLYASVMPFISLSYFLTYSIFYISYSSVIHFVLFYCWAPSTLSFSVSSVGPARLGVVSGLTGLPLVDHVAAPWNGSGSDRLGALRDFSSCGWPPPKVASSEILSTQPSVSWGTTTVWVGSVCMSICYPSAGVCVWLCINCICISVCINGGWEDWIFLLFLPPVRHCFLHICTESAINKAICCFMLFVRIIAYFGFIFGFDLCQCCCSLLQWLMIVMYVCELSNCGRLYVFSGRIMCNDRYLGFLNCGMF